jgi:hypothetical protein
MFRSIWIIIRAPYTLNIIRLVYIYIIHISSCNGLWLSQVKSVLRVQSVCYYRRWNIILVSCVCLEWIAVTDPHYVHSLTKYFWLLNQSKICKCLIHVAILNEYSFQVFSPKTLGIKGRVTHKWSSKTCNVWCGLDSSASRVRFSMGLLEFFIDLILLAALWPWGRLSL